MNNKPNMYRVHYQVMEGDHRAGGWGNRIADVETLGDAERFNKVQSVVPIFIEIGEPINSLDVLAAIDTRKQDRAQLKKKEDVEYAKARLNEAQAELNK